MVGQKTNNNSKRHKHIRFILGHVILIAVAFITAEYLARVSERWWLIWNRPFFYLAHTSSINRQLSIPLPTSEKNLREHFGSPKMVISRGTDGLFYYQYPYDVTELYAEPPKTSAARKELLNTIPKPLKLHEERHLFRSMRPGGGEALEWEKSLPPPRYKNFRVYAYGGGLMYTFVWIDPNGQAIHRTFVAD